MISPNKLFIAIGIVSSVSASAQTVHEFSLEQAMDYAVQHNYQLQQSKIDVELSQRKVKETTSIGLPQVNGEASFNNYIDIPTQVARASTFDPSAPANALVPLRFGLPYSVSAGITASQLIFDGSYFVGLKAAKGYVQYAELGLEKTEIEVKNSVAQTYFAALASQENIKALRDNKENILKTVEETMAMFNAGVLEQQDADQVKLLESNITNQLDFAQRQSQNIQNLLKFQMGIPVTDSIHLTDSIDAIVEAQTANSLTLLEQDFTASRHIDLRTLEQSEELSALSLSNERARYYPRLSAFFNHSQNAYRTTFDFFNGAWYPTTLWGFKLQVPIFSSLQGYQRVAQAKLELSKVQSQKAQMEQNLAIMAASARNDYNSAIDRYETVKQDLEMARSIRERTRVKYNEGIASSNDLTQTENQYLTTLGNYINTTLELLNAKLALDKALGNY